MITRINIRYYDGPIYCDVTVYYDHLVEKKTNLTPEETRNKLI